MKRQWQQYAVAAVLRGQHGGTLTRARELVLSACVVL